MPVSKKTEPLNSFDMDPTCFKSNFAKQSMVQYGKGSCSSVSGVNVAHSTSKDAQHIYSNHSIKPYYLKEAKVPVSHNYNATNSKLPPKTS